MWIPTLIVIFVLVSGLALWLITCRSNSEADSLKSMFLWRYLKLPPEVIPSENLQYTFKTIQDGETVSKHNMYQALDELNLLIK